MRAGKGRGRKRPDTSKEGSPDPIGALIGWKPRQWRSTRVFLVEGRRGNFETETDQIASLYDRMEYCLGKTHAGKLPDSIVADLLGREMKEWREGREGDPGHI